MTPEEHRALIKSMSAGWYALGLLYSQFQRQRTNPDFSRKHDPNLLYLSAGIPAKEK